MRSPADAVVLVVLAWSLVALALCVWCAVARLVFSLAREGVLPRALGNVTPRGMPMVAALAVTPLALAPPLLSVALGPGIGAFAWDLKVSGGVVICLAYALTSASLIRFLHVIDELSPLPVVAAVVAGVATGAVAVRQLVLELQDGIYTAPVLLLAAGLCGATAYICNRRRSRQDGRYIGMHDEALASAVLLPPDGRAGAHGQG